MSRTRVTTLTIFVIKLSPLKPVLVQAITTILFEGI